MDFDIARQSCWTYPTSDARSGPLPPQGRSHQITSPYLPSPPPEPSSPLPVQIEPGVWYQDDDILHASNWPPVQRFLAQIREERRMVDTPSDLIFALAALDVLYNPHDPAHWIFWAPVPGSKVGDTVDKIALHKPRLVKSSVPWTGFNVYKHIIAAIQEKFRYVYLKRKWYPVDDRPTETQKRTLRSSGEPVEQTVNEFFNLVATSPRKSGKFTKKDKTTSLPIKRAPRAVAGPSAKPTPTDEVVSVDAQLAVLEESSSSNRLGIRKRRNVTSASRSPQAISVPTTNTSSKETHHSSEPSPSLSSSSSSSSHSRSTSQSSLETLVANERCSSVASSDTVVGALPSKKRKAGDREKDDEHSKDQEDESTSTEGMVTRGRASKIRSVDSEESSLSSRKSTPAPASEARSKTTTRPKARAKRARV
ncbi:hypothetical protein GALMADRAFT_226411 [Galerina marginata CBS 339.88]|uniref:Uncharacterized protein n=1 Tax=Galerina marginata (strain CBS 339.88) TaxID=685588 RepID=A0A067SXT2_GALM3|nr:hypothetical protein GALMADRAFT_226411 [Galerina marginata CBS 339.88]